MMKQKVSRNRREKNDKKGEKAARGMFMVREIETYVRENAGDVVQEGRWR